ncbi:MAG: DUF547 domain-containing protein [Pseudomonadota bacterium]
MLVFLFGVITCTVKAAPGSNLLGFWVQSNEKNQNAIDHQPWQQLLDRYLITKTSDEVYRFDYAKVTTEDKHLLAGYLKHLQGLDPRLYARVTQKAYWINLYNALTVQVILSNYPVDSIKDIKTSLLDFGGPWNDKVATVAGQALTLNDIEHGILRPIWQDNRIHYAVNCASLGCPNLWPQVYTAENTESLLEQAARNYINHSRGVSLNNGKLTVSSIFDWYQEDFDDSEAGVLTHLQKYAEPDLKKQLSSYQGRLHYDYDWQLNAP